MTTDTLLETETCAQQSEVMLRITEVFFSLQGESSRVGLPTVFVRLTGCPLRCHYCDTAYAFRGGELQDLRTVLGRVCAFDARYVCVTGGEPLAQQACLPLLTALCDLGYEVSLETSGARDIREVDPRVLIVMDIKTPASGECDKNRFENLNYLKPTDQIKFVLGNRADYEWACECLVKHALVRRVDEVLFSPVWDQLSPTELADWIVKDNIPVRFQYQLHKVLWHDTPGH